MLSAILKSAPPKFAHKVPPTLSNMQTFELPVNDSCRHRIENSDMKSEIKLVEPVLTFLNCRTPDAWIQSAITDLPTLLIDHANCEKKAASTALTLMHRYIGHFDLLNKMSRLAREELRHFEQVVAVMAKRNIEYLPVKASRYASSLYQHIRKEEPHRLVDTLIVGAVIEARSCERFFSLLPHLDEELAAFYQSLLKSEARHFQDYLALAKQNADVFSVDKRTDFFLGKDRELVLSVDTEMKFHSGIPQKPAASNVAADFTNSL